MTASFVAVPGGGANRELDGMGWPLDPGLRDRFFQAAADSFVFRIMSEAGLEIDQMGSGEVAEAITALEGVVAAAQLRLRDIREHQQTLQQQ